LRNEVVTLWFIMTPTIVQSVGRTPQLIAVRKVGRPQKDRPVSEVAQLVRKRGSDGEASKIVADEGLLYDADAVDGFSVNKWVPKGQFIDVYA